VVNVASIAGYGWRANLERAKTFVSAPGFPDLAKLLAAYQVPDAEAYPVSKEFLLLWTMRAAHQPLFKDRGLRVNAVSPGPVTTPILEEFRQIFGDPRVDDDIARAGRAGSAPTSRPPCCSSARTARAGSTAPICRSTEVSKPRSTRRFSDSNQPDFKPRRMKRGEVNRHGEERSDEAIQGWQGARRLLDCFPPGLKARGSQ
jgi:NAD(P)-dependent dehydrogenase (short-subunit alcohol dehydrogenase family)